MTENLAEESTSSPRIPSWNMPPPPLCGLELPLPPTTAAHPELQHPPLLCLSLLSSRRRQGVSILYFKLDFDSMGREHGGDVWGAVSIAISTGWAKVECYRHD